MHCKLLLHSSCQLSWHLNIWSVRELGTFWNQAFSSTCVVSWCRVWSTGIFLCVCLDHCDNLFLSSFSGALQGFDLKSEFSSHQDTGIKSMCKWWLTPISGAGFHNFTKISLENHSCFIVYISNCYEIGTAHPSLPVAAWYCISEFWKCSMLLNMQVICSMFFMLLPI